MTEWGDRVPGVVEFGDGRRVRGASLRAGIAGPPPEFVLYLARRRPDEPAWPYDWIRWPDFRRPLDPPAATASIVAAWQRAERERVVVTCAGGRGRTGTVLACLAVLDGRAPEQAVVFVRQAYHPRAAETRGQHRFVAEFAAAVD